MRATDKTRQVLEKKGNRDGDNVMKVAESTDSPFNHK
jgi:hypothetical protein